MLVTLVHEETGETQRSVGVAADWPRLEASFELIARAIYCHHIGERNLLPAKVICEFQLQIDGPAPQAVNELMLGMVAGLDELFAGKEMHEANRSVFRYQRSSGVRTFAPCFRPGRLLLEGQPSLHCVQSTLKEGL